MSLDSLLSSLLTGRLPPMGMDKEPVVIKNIHHALFGFVVDTAADHMRAGFTQEEALRLTHAGLTHCLGFLEEVILDKNPKTFATAEDFNDYWKNAEDARRNNMRLGSKHFKFHQENIAAGGPQGGCTDDHFVELSKKD